MTASATPDASALTGPRRPSPPPHADARHDDQGRLPGAFIGSTGVVRSPELSPPPREHASAPGRRSIAELQAALRAASSRRESGAEADRADVTPLTAPRGAPASNTGVIAGQGGGDEQGGRGDATAHVGEGHFAVLSAHPGAGCSVVALAVAEAAAGCGVEVHLV